MGELDEEKGKSVVGNGLLTWNKEKVEIYGFNIGEAMTGWAVFPNRNMYFGEYNNK